MYPSWKQLSKRFILAGKGPRDSTLSSSSQTLRWAPTAHPPLLAPLPILGVIKPTKGVLVLYSGRRSKCVGHPHSKRKENYEYEDQMKIKGRQMVMLIMNFLVSDYRTLGKNAAASQLLINVIVRIEFKKK